MTAPPLHRAEDRREVKTPARHGVEVERFGQIMTIRVAEEALLGRTIADVCVAVILAVGYGAALVAGSSLNDPDSTNTTISVVSVVACVGVFIAWRRQSGRMRWRARSREVFRICEDSVEVAGRVYDVSTVTGADVLRRGKRDGDDLAALELDCRAATDPLWLPRRCAVVFDHGAEQLASIEGLSVVQARLIASEVRQLLATRHVNRIA